jgi:branched-chain amino acid transport system permease protein
VIILELLVQGIVQGSLYALIAVGLTLVYGLLRILHIAHAALVTLGGYIGVLVTNATGSLALAMIAAILVVGVAGMAVYRLCYEPVLDKPPYVALIISIGLFVALQEAFRLIFGPYGISFLTHPFPAVMNVLGASLKQGEVVVLAGTALLFVALFLFATRTRTGIAWRASVTDPAMARSFGVNLIRIRYVNFFVGSALAAIAGVMVAGLNNVVEPTMGNVPSYKALAVIVLGGLGDVRGTLAAALALGVIEAFGTVYLGTLLDRDAIAFVFLIAVLLIRPQGLFARR